jgi:anaerobic magnesium-protoporphyrin IX monomethyl ester cyclase
VRILFIWPKGYDSYYTIPLPFAYLKSNITSPEHEIRLIDCTLENLRSDSIELQNRIRDFQPDLIGISAMSTVIAEALAILRMSKNVLPEVVTIVGGSHATCYPESLLKRQEVDFVFRGEVEFSFPVFLDTFSEGTARWKSVEGLCFRSSDSTPWIGDVARVRDLDSVKIPDYDFVNLEGYIAAGYRLDSPTMRNAPIWATRGCPYRCAFCSAPKINGKAIRKHSVEYLVRWVTDLYERKGIRWINIIDDNFTFHPDYAAEFCEKIIELKLRDLGFSTCNGIRMSRGNPQLWRLMKQAGWQFAIIAPESGSDRVLKLMKKDAQLDQLPKVIGDIKQTGLLVKGFFMLGYPGETEQDLAQTREIILKNDFDFVYFNNFQPLPGTEIFEELSRKGEIPDVVNIFNYSDGARSYTPRQLKNFNFSKFVLTMYASLIVRNPRILGYLMRHYSMSFLMKKLFLNTWNMVRSWL